ncbi:unnamed protein product [Ilex paraguariensis]|uniref:Uncharacterized protein n=1 Tax=Ilex paraguariensis TaxID=185542 RepID=A0ABC8SXA4_9AQUA
MSGRNISVKLADNHKSKVVQAQLPAAMVPAPMPLAAGYPQPGLSHTNATPVGYVYPQAMGAYSNTAYPIPPPAASQYSTQPHISYPQYAVKKDPLGASPTHAGTGGYPYYIPKQ